MSWIDEERGQNENGTHWKLRRAFLMRYENEYPRGRLKCLSMIFSNVIFLSCKYDGPIMKQIDNFAKELEAEVQEAKQTKVLRTTFSLPTLDSEEEEEEEDEEQMDDYTKLSREMSRMKIPEPETIPSPLPRPGFTPIKRDFASPPTKRDIARAPGLIPMSLIKVQDQKSTTIVRADMPRGQKNKPDNINVKSGEKQIVKPVTIVTAPKSKKAPNNGKGDLKTPNDDKSDEKLAEKAAHMEFTKKKKNKNKKKKPKPSNEECRDEEPVGAVISAEDLDEPDKTACDSAEKQSDNCQKNDDKSSQETAEKTNPDSAEKQSDNCQKDIDKSEQGTAEKTNSDSVEKQSEICQKSDKKPEEEATENTTRDSTDKESENCQKKGSGEEEIPDDTTCKSVEKEGDVNQKDIEANEEITEKTVFESTEKQSENCQEHEDEAATTIVKETDEES